MIAPTDDGASAATTRAEEIEAEAAKCGFVGADEPAALPKPGRGSDAGFATPMDPFLSSFRDPELMETLVAYPETRQHLADPGFVEEIKRLQKLATDPNLDVNDITQTCVVSQKIAQAGQYDPRVMQAMMSLQGQSLLVEEKDLKKAEEFGDMKRREPIQLEQMALVKDMQNPEECRVKGNEYFKSGDFNAALAHYEKGVELLKKRQDQAFPASQLATLLSNASFCYLKLKWPDRAKKTASLALVALREGKEGAFDQSKLFYRRALACEQLREFDMAVEDMGHALQHAKKSDASLAEQHRLKNERERLKKLRTSHLEAEEKRKREKEAEKKAEVERLQGKPLEGGATTESAKKPAAVPPNEGSYLSEQDFSHWARQQITQVIVGIVHKGASGCHVEIKEVVQQPSKVSASITTKRGNRALYYDIDLHMKWKGRPGPKLKRPDDPDEIDGLIRVYNIAHDTKFELGGDHNTSYMYQLGWDQRLTGPWIDDLQVQAAELFDLVAAAVDGVIEKLRSK